MFHRLQARGRHASRQPLAISLLLLCIHNPVLASENHVSAQGPAPSAESDHGHEHQHEQKHPYEAHGHGHGEHSGGHAQHTAISDSFARDAGVVTAVADPQRIRVTERLYGRIQPHGERIARVKVPYPGEIIELNVSVGDEVKKGAVLARVKSRESLAVYVIKAPLTGVIVERHLNAGELVDSEALVTLLDVSEVWVDLLAYPDQRNALQEGQPFEVQDLDGQHSSDARIGYIAPNSSSENQATLVRATLANPEGVWSPGLMVSGEVVVADRKVPVAVKRSALQTLDGSPVVFVKSGERYTARSVELGDSDGGYVEVLDGLEPGSEYVTENSYLIKADLLKAGASHAH